MSTQDKNVMCLIFKIACFVLITGFDQQLMLVAEGAQREGI